MSHRQNGEIAPPAPPSDPRYGYFVLQALSGDDGISGVVENLTTGTKHRFESAEGLAGLLHEWGHRTRNVP